MLLFELTTAFPLLALDSFPLLKWQHLLVLHSKSATLEIEVIQIINDNSCLVSRREVCKCKATEDSVIEVIIESIWQRKAHLRHHIDQLLFSDRERYILDDDGSGYKLIVAFLGVGTPMRRT